MFGKLLDLADRRKHDKSIGLVPQEPLGGRNGTLELLLVFDDATLQVLQVELDSDQSSIDFGDQGTGFTHRGNRSEHLASAVLGLGIVMHLGDLLSDRLGALEKLIG
jgi:hypothetical protein